MNDQAVGGRVSGKIIGCFYFEAEIDVRNFSIVGLSRTIYADKWSQLFIFFSRQIRLRGIPFVIMFLEIGVILIEHRKQVFVETFVEIFIRIFD